MCSGVFLLVAFDLEFSLTMQLQKCLFVENSGNVETLEEEKQQMALEPRAWNHRRSYVFCLGYFKNFQESKTLVLKVRDVRYSLG